MPKGQPPLRSNWLIGVIVALVGAIIAIVLGSVFTMWILVGDRGPRPHQLLMFAFATLLLAWLGALPGILICRSAAGFPHSRQFSLRSLLIAITIIAIILASVIAIM